MQNAHTIFVCENPMQIFEQSISGPRIIVVAVVSVNNSVSIFEQLISELFIIVIAISCFRFFVGVDVACLHFASYSCCDKFVNVCFCK